MVDQAIVFGWPGMLILLMWILWRLGINLFIAVCLRALHTRVMITVAYGVNDVIGRRVLWADLTRLSTLTTTVPWLVGGDFNTVVDTSEVCGQSGDIRGAAEEFRGCLRDTGLITLPMQGERFTWHNCSRDSRSLWKRLDRLLANDQWLTTWPSTSYLSLNARTSDHSPLVLRGNATDRTVGMFRFDNYLARSTEFIPSVQRVWQHRIVGTAMYEVTRKLKALKPIELRDGRKAISQTGRLLKQVNTTLISLIPKVSNPAVVAEFRPISCCNVLYKVITKILVQRMRGILDMLISPSQNAFVPGRAIGDNILLAQELFSGYNQKHLPPRCALKVDLRKAYDTVEWDFLRAVLMLFGFPEQFIQWIVVCVTTPSFSVCLNGAPHGFFRGARGLRQGDPMSPFLFVLVMEVLTLILQQIEQNGGFSFHWRCDRIQLFQLGFADDLLLFSKADPNSVSLFKEGLTTFAELSGLQANLHKSHLILSSSAAPLRATLLTILGFQEGHLPLRYLGLPPTSIQTVGS
ncbi:UNVERIFIED_CONTAM: Retrovirus-related Pol polyprotein from type-2 retrotransposable element R2DM [Sesamum radiatum]|uniref:Retrovirus-related Pol polyprotein from type-2 retrotransposable element R2DM n=1 Tax=Sesamum radiatum TaxID=300843 RepID=A0AAW2JC93_SESRA